MVGDKPDEDAEAEHTAKVFRGPEIMGMLRNTVQSERHTVAFFITVTKNEICLSGLPGLGSGDSTVNT